MLQLEQAILYDFELAGRRVRFWKRVGESYEHVLMKALGYAMFVNDYQDLQIETPVGLRYKPDLVARDEHGRFRFWGECGQISMRKLGWLLKHAGVERLVIFKIGIAISPLADEVRAQVPAKYRQPGRLEIINFVPGIVELTIERRIPHVPPTWYATHAVTEAK